MHPVQPARYPLSSSRFHLCVFRFSPSLHFRLLFPALPPLLCIRFFPPCQLLCRECMNVKNQLKQLWNGNKREVPSHKKNLSAFKHFYLGMWSTTWNRRSYSRPLLISWTVCDEFMLMRRPLYIEFIDARKDEATVQQSSSCLPTPNHRALPSLFIRKLCELSAEVLSMSARNSRRAVSMGEKK